MPVITPNNDPVHISGRAPAANRKTPPVRDDLVDDLECIDAAIEGLKDEITDLQDHLRDLEDEREDIADQLDQCEDTDP